MRQLQNTLYITNDNIKTKVNRQAFEFMENDGTDIMHVPVHEIEKILVFGNNNFDESMYTKCAELGVGLYFFTANGRLRYRIEGRTKGNVVVRKQQYLLSGTQGFIDDKRQDTELYLCDKPVYVEPCGNVGCRT